MILDEKLFINESNSKKLTFNEFVNYLYSINNGYHAFSKVSGEKGSGYRYTLSNKLTQEQKDYLAQYPNVQIGSATYKYAPEQKYDTVILLNRIFKVEESKVPRYTAKEVNGKGYIYDRNFSNKVPSNVDKDIETARKSVDRWNKEESLKEDIKEQYIVEIQPDTEQELFNDYAGALDYFNARVSDYKKESRNSDVSVALYKVVDDEIIDTLKYWKKDETLKEEYGTYKDAPYCEEIADRLEDGFWNGYTGNDTEWDLEVNGLSRSEFAPAFADWLAESISYPVRAGHLSFMDLDMFIAKNSIPGFHDSDDAEKLIPDLVKLGIDREDIDDWLKNPNADEELEFWIDYDVNFDVDEWEDNNREDVDLPTEVTYDFYSLVDDDVDINSDDYNLDDVIADRLIDDYGYTHDGFNYDVDKDSGDVYVYDIKWDISESLKESHTNTNKQPLKPATFKIDDDHPFEGYDEEYDWNGWECPWFTKEVGDTIVDYYKDYMHFNAEKDAFVYVSPDDDRDIDYFEGQDIKTVDGIKHLYPIGNKSWIWYKYSEDEDLEEDYTHFTYKSGANPYIAKTNKEAQRILNKYKGKVKETKKGFYEIDDTKEDTIAQGKAMFTNSQKNRNFCESFDNKTILDLTIFDDNKIFEKKFNTIEELDNYIREISGLDLKADNNSDTAFNKSVISRDYKGDYHYFNSKNGDKVGDVETYALLRTYIERYPDGYGVSYYDFGYISPYGWRQVDDRDINVIESSKSHKGHWRELELKEDKELDKEVSAIRRDMTKVGMSPKKSREEHKKFLSKLKDKRKEIKESTEPKKSKQLNEGAGAGYTVQGELYEIKINHIEDVEVYQGKSAFGTDLEFAKVKVDADASFNGTVEGYYYGAVLGGAQVKITEFDINPNILYYLGLEEFNYGEITAEDLQSQLGSTLKFKSDVIGGGWIHTPFNGNVTASRVDDNYSPFVDGVSFHFVNQVDIEYAEQGLQGELDEDYSVLQDIQSDSIEHDFEDITNMSDAKERLKKYGIDLIKKDNQNYVLRKDGKKYTFYVLSNPNEVRKDLVKAVHKLTESSNGRNIKENIGSDIAEYQKWVDYDMKKYGRISSLTNHKIRKAGLKIVKDKYGDYEVIANESLKEDTDIQLIRKFYNEKTPKNKMELNHKLRDMGLKHGVSGVHSSDLEWVELNGKRYEIKKTNKGYSVTKISDSTKVEESLSNKELDDMIEISHKIGLNTLDDLQDFLKRQQQPSDVTIIDTLKRYSKEFDESKKYAKKTNEDIDFSNENYLLKPYWYSTTHGVTVGSIPKNVKVWTWFDGDNKSFFATSDIISAEDLKEYEIKEESPNVEDIPEHSRIQIQKYLEQPLTDNDMKISIKAQKVEEDLSADTNPIKPKDTGLAQLLIDAINGEWETIQLYNDISINANNEKIAEIIKQINADEYTHVGLLQTALDLIAPNTNTNLEKGNEQANEIIDNKKEKVEDVQ